jgi:glycosyltransferase involved in cell wall biosynthesis
VDAFIAPSAHARSKFILGGLDPDRIFIKPNFVLNPPTRSSAPSKSDIIVYAGRLSSEKGPHILLEAWARTQPGNRGRLLFVGNGLEAASLQSRVAALGLSSSVQFAGRKGPAEALRIISGARALVCPSLCSETFGNAIVEAYSVGTPVIVSRAGAFEEIVTDGHTGFTVPPGDVEALGRALNRILSDGPLADRLGSHAHSEYLERYTPDRNYEMLMRIYEFAVRHRGEAGQTPPIAVSVARN